MTSGDFLKKIREKKNISLRVASIKSGVSHTQISDVEKGINFGKKDRLENILNAVGLTVDEKKKFYELQDYEKTPESVKEKIKKLEEAIKELKRKKFTGLKIECDVSELSCEKLKELNKFVKYLKNS